MGGNDIVVVHFGLQREDSLSIMDKTVCPNVSVIQWFHLHTLAAS